MKERDKARDERVLIAALACICAFFVIGMVSCIIREDRRWIGLAFVSLAAILALITRMASARDSQAGRQTEECQKKRARVDSLAIGCFLIGFAVNTIYYINHRDHRMISTVITMLIMISVVIMSRENRRAGDDAVSGGGKKGLLVNFLLLIALTLLLVYYIVRYDVRFIIMLFYLWKVGVDIVKKLGWIHGTDDAADTGSDAPDPTAQP